MSVVLFCGPSVRAEEASAIVPSARIRGPATCGDVYRAVQEGAQAVGICDGYFDHQLSVWHKEVLWALMHRVRVYGSASMGALRAAELHGFGMLGVGLIFEQYRDGVLEDDDEVALAHESQERDYRPSSEAMVNVRATLAVAVARGVLSEKSRQQWIEVTKSMFYPERTYEEIFLRVLAAGAPESEVRGFRDWLEKHGPVNQKRLDALAMLERMRDDLLELKNRQNSPPSFEFEYTDAWDAFRRTIDRPVAPEVSEAARERALALALAEAAGFSADAEAVQRRSEEFRRERGLLTEEDTAVWMSRNGLGVEEFSLLMYEDVLAEAFRGAAKRVGVEQLPSVLRLRAR